MDKYRSFTELVRHEREGEDFLIRTREGTSGVVVVAPHGGKIEPGTMEIADAVAGVAHSFYAFEGRRSRPSWHLHVTSNNFDEPRALAIVTRHERVLTVHGCKGNHEAVYLGGLDQDLMEEMGNAFGRHGFWAGPSPSPTLQGKGRRNICNRGSTGRGVQLEITRGLREQMFKDLRRRKLPTVTFDAFVGILRVVLE
jgi:phage replication-related protein YjqB (UPF0714/DUF867 family)